MEPLYPGYGSFRPLAAGFTLVELLVVLAIILTITSIALSSQSSFNKTLILANTAYDIGLTLRSAESFGLGSRSLGGVANAGYGLHFTALAGSFTLFSDTYPPIGSSPSVLCHGQPSYDAYAPSAQPGNCAYDPGSESPPVQTYTLNNGIYISDFCAYNGGSWLCTYAHDGYSAGLTSLDIVFARPNPTAFITANGSSNTFYTGACITVKSPQGVTPRYVSISASGEISANAASCP